METEFETNLQCTNISYLRARDPSILACGHPLGKAKANLDGQILKNISNPTTDTPKDDDDHLQVYLRLKKTEHFRELYEINDKTLYCKVPEGAQCIRNVRNGTSVTKLFTFSKIFGPQSSQTDLFNDIVKEKILSFINGFNCSLLTYGASGSGKTYTIMGTASEPGIIPRALEYLFKTLPQLSEEPKVKPADSGKIIRLSNSTKKLEKAVTQNLLDSSTLVDRVQHVQTYKTMQQQLIDEPVATIADNIDDVSLAVWVSFAEIYNESVYDLLTPQPLRGQPRKKLRLGHYRGSAYIKDLTNINVTSGLQAYQLLQYGLHNLQYAATAINDHSSRSHSIFTIRLVQASDTKEDISISAFNFCDLAGSERIKKTHNVGDRLKESNNINTSLLVLGRCINLIRKSQKQNINKLIPFRESKLTQLFQRALLGQEAICMIINVNPVREMFDESQHVLNFSAIAKDVTIEQQQLLQRLPNNRFTQYIENRSSAFPDVTKELEAIEIENLRAIKDRLANELQQKKKDFEKQRQLLLTQSAKLLEDTSQRWKQRFQELKNDVAKNRELMESSRQQARKRKIPVIVLDSSSEDENDLSVKTRCKSCRKNGCKAYETFIVWQKELTEAKLQLQLKETEMQALEEKNKSLEKTLLDATKTYKDLEGQYQTETQELNKNLIQQQDEINILTAYRENCGTLSSSGFSTDEEYKHAIAMLWSDES